MGDIKTPPANRLGLALLEAAGLDSKGVTAVSLHVEAGDIARLEVTAVVYGDAETEARRVVRSYRLNPELVSEAPLALAEQSDPALAPLLESLQRLMAQCDAEAARPTEQMQCMHEIRAELQRGLAEMQRELQHFQASVSALLSSGIKVRAGLPPGV